MITSHTDVVGSLLRPQELLNAREALEAGRLSHVEFKAIEDKAVGQAIALQEEAGLEIVTDGEMRRLSFQSQIIYITGKLSSFSDIKVHINGKISCLFPCIL